jgi:hypothetical protein
VAREHKGEGAYFDKGVDGEDDELGLRLGIVHEVEIDELFLLEVFCLLFLSAWRFYEFNSDSAPSWCLVITTPNGALSNIQDSRA